MVLCQLLLRRSEDMILLLRVEKRLLELRIIRHVQFILQEDNHTVAILALQETYNQTTSLQQTH